MKSRKEYLAKQCTHAEYYGQFVDSGIKARVTNSIGMDRLLKSTDKHLNDIPLKEWDRLIPIFPAHIGQAMRDAGDYPTLAGAVCIAKEAARQLISEVAA